jgi:tRNA pseudouridine55 synthase
VNGALLIDKPEGVSSFGVIELLQKSLGERLGVRRRDLPKLGHGGTLDPFATGLLVVCIGEGVKLARYLLGSVKGYEGVIRFGETTIPGDPTDPVSERSEHLPRSLEEIQNTAAQLTRQTYLQTPPMHSAKKKDGKPLYELARQGIEIDREPTPCELHSFEIRNYEAARASFSVTCSAGTYIRVLAQDLGRLLGSVAMLDSLRRTRSGSFTIARAMTLNALRESTEAWDVLPCFVPFHRMLDGYFDRAIADPSEELALIQGRQGVLFNLLKKTEAVAPEPTSRVAIYSEKQALVAVAAKIEGAWKIERVFVQSDKITA